MKREIALCGVLLFIVATAWPQQTIVFPAVSDEVEGRNGSLWVTVARVIKVDPSDTVVVRRKWVCLPNGGFVDDPATAPYWRLPAGSRSGRLMLAWGEDLLFDTDSVIGAVALEVEGGLVMAHSTIIDVSRGMNVHRLLSFGQGQFVKGLEIPLQTPSHISYIGGCLNRPCSNETPEVWDFLRNNIGLVNPNPEPIEIRGIVIPFTNAQQTEKELRDDFPEEFVRQLPAYGWLQFSFAANHLYYWDYLPNGEPGIPDAGFVVSLTPNNDNPYFAYTSVVFTPDPDSGIPIFNDPMFVPAEPGYVAPFAEVYPPPKEEEE